MFAFKCCVLAPLQPVEFELCKWRFDEISYIVNNPKPGIMCLRNRPGVRQISILIMPLPLSSQKACQVADTRVIIIRKKSNLIYCHICSIDFLGLSFNVHTPSYKQNLYLKSCVWAMKRDVLTFLHIYTASQAIEHPWISLLLLPLTPHPEARRT